MSEESLCKFMDGEEEALNEVIQTYSKPLSKYCYSVLGNYHDVEDAVQTAFVRVYQKRRTIQNSKTFPSFLYRTAYHICIDMIRKQKRFLIPVKEEVQESYMSEELYEALMKLKPLDRAVIYNKVVNEMSYKELSEIYGKSEVSLRKRMERIKAKLKKELLQGNVSCSSLCEEVVK